jgi:hypothetical protein
VSAVACRWSSRQHHSSQRRCHPDSPAPHWRCAV